MTIRLTIAITAGCAALFASLGLGPASQTTTGTITRLPSLGSNAEALGVNGPGTVIVGQSFDRSGMLYAVKWTRQNGAWVISTLPYPGSAIARSIDAQGNVVGYGASSPRHAVLWPAAGGYIVLGCGDADNAVAYAISGDGQTIVGQRAGRAVAWQAPASCTEDLSPLEPGGWSSAAAVNGDGSVIGGNAAYAGQADAHPVRWIGISGQRQIETLDSRPGNVFGANASGDLAGLVTVPCAVAGGCKRALIWYGAGGSRELGTLGGADSWARAINSSREVAGSSTSPRVGNTGYFWSEAAGMFQLPANRWAAANTLSDVRPDGTRLVAGMDSQANAVAWVVRTP
jgi:uncharacterized membrane protein